MYLEKRNKRNYVQTKRCKKSFNIGQQIRLSGFCVYYERNALITAATLSKVGKED